MALRLAYETRRYGRLIAETFSAQGFSAEMDKAELHISNRFLEPIPGDDDPGGYVSFSRDELNTIWEMVDLAKELRGDDGCIGKINRAGIEFVLEEDRFLVGRTHDPQMDHISFRYDQLELIKDTVFLCQAREQFYSR
jgi:hypothetical protein